MSDEVVRLAIYGTIRREEYTNDTGVPIDYYARGGNDIVYNWVSDSRLFGEDGDDQLYNYGDDGVSDGGTGGDFIHSEGDRSILRGRGGDDILYNYGNDVVIVAGPGHDEIHNYLNEHVFIKGNGGNDIIYNTFGDYAVINSGNSHDVITNTDSVGVTIDASSGKDVITNVRSNGVTIQGGVGGDSITIEDSFNAVVNGDEHADVITVVGGDFNDLTGGQGYDQLFGGAGQETMHYHYADNKSNGDVYYGGDGVDTLKLHFLYKDLLELSAAHDYSSVEEYLQAVEAKFNSKDENWYGNYGFNLKAGQFEQLVFDVAVLPNVSIEDASVIEGSNGESSFLEFAVNLSHASDQEIAVDYSTAGLSASSLLNADYAPVHGRLTFAQGETSKMLSVEVFGDNAEELSETLSVHLQNADGAYMLSGMDSAIGTILDDDVALTDPLAAPILNSNLAADKILYLDFDGELVTNTAWNSSIGLEVIDAKAFDRDGDVTSFNADELESIESIFGRVSEDFMPFNVNVTTDYSVYAAASNADRLNVIITDTHDWYPGYGGVAYLDVEGLDDEYYQPGWVFADPLGNDSKNVAEAVSHELGHNLGLHHDGNNVDAYYPGHGSDEAATSWAPIMGVGYYKQLTQWSQGEYYKAKEDEDDIAIIAEAYGFRADDHGNSRSDASMLHIEEGTFAAEGLIEQRTDVDIFTHTASADLITYVINGLEEGSNLDILANLYDKGGNLLASSNSEDSITATIEYQFDAETEVFLSVEGTGMGDPLLEGYTDYGSLGYYSVTVA